MALPHDVAQILEMGIRKEQAAHDLYLRAADQVTDPWTKDVLEQMAGQENKHERLLRTWRDEGRCPAPDSAFEADHELIERGHAPVEEHIAPAAGPEEAVDLGLDMERRSIAYYDDLAARFEDDDARNLIRALRAEETKHITVLEKIKASLHGAEPTPPPLG